MHLIQLPNPKKTTTITFYKMQFYHKSLLILKQGRDGKKIFGWARLFSAPTRAHPLNFLLGGRLIYIYFLQKIRDFY